MSICMTFSKGKTKQKVCFLLLLSGILWMVRKGHFVPVSNWTLQVTLQGEVFKLQWLINCFHFQKLSHVEWVACISLRHLCILSKGRCLIYGKVHSYHTSTPWPLLLSFSIEPYNGNHSAQLFLSLCSYERWASRWCLHVTVFNTLS